MRILFIFLMLFGFHSASLAERNTRIIGGEDAQEGAYPWLVSIHNSGNAEPDCGGSLIHPQWVLTAAHCLDNSRGTRVLEPAELFVMIGMHDYSQKDTQGIRIDVEQVIQHPEWKTHNDIVFPDIGLLKLKQPVTNVTPIAFVRDRNSSLFKPGNMATIMGWGRTVASSRLYPDILQQVEVPLVDFGVCQKAYQGEEIILHYSICAGYAEGGKDSCSGDSGGPLVMKDEKGQWQQLGLVSFGGKDIGPLCAGANAYGVYTQPAAFADFIDQYVPKKPLYQGLWRSAESAALFSITTTDEYMAIVVLDMQSTWFAFVGSNQLGTIQLNSSFATSALEATLTPHTDTTATLDIIHCDAGEACPLSIGQYHLTKLY